MEAAFVSLFAFQIELRSKNCAPCARFALYQMGMVAAQTAEKDVIGLWVPIKSRPEFDG
jgi:hypothetical protein